MDGAIKVKLTAPPVEGEANEACLRFFSELLKIPVNSVSLVSGRTGRNKIIKVYGITANKLMEILSL